MADNIHRCPQMPPDTRVLVTGNEVWQWSWPPPKLEELHDSQCPYCGAVLVSDDERYVRVEDKPSEFCPRCGNPSMLKEG